MSEVYHFDLSPDSSNCGVYAIVNTVNGKCYIGSTMDMSQRWKDHRKLLKRGKHHSPHLQNAYNLYGHDAFEYVVIESVPGNSKALLLEREQFYIDTKYPEYNVSPAARSPAGVTRSLEFRSKMSKAKKAYVFTEEHRRNLSKANKGKGKGRHVSEEQIRKAAETRAKNRALLPQKITYELQYRKCGDLTCKSCREGQGHGPYWYAYWREGNRVKSKYIGKNKPV